MRLLTFSFLRNCRYKALSYPIPNRFRSDAVQTKIGDKPAKDVASGGLVEVLESWPADVELKTRAAVLADMRVIPDFISEGEEAELMRELDPYLKKMRYEFDHWDDAIHGYRETERSNWNAANAAVLKRVLEIAFPPGLDSGEPLPHQHVLDLANTGHIKPHVDAVRFCGNVIAGVSLLSAAVMQLVHTARPPLALNAYLPRRSLYIMRGTARYDFTHAVLGGEASVWRGTAVPRLRRVAVITRSRPAPAAAAPRGSETAARNEGRYSR